MSDAPTPTGQLVRWVGSWATIIAPATVLSAVLFYFGYVSSRAQYEYFGIDVDAIGLSTRDYVMRSPQPLLVPLLVLVLLAAALLVLDAAVSTRVGAAVAEAGEDPRAPTGGRVPVLRRLTRVTSMVGLVGLAAGVALLLGYRFVRDWVFYDLATPLIFVVGAGLVAYASRVSALLGRQRTPQAPPDPPDSSAWLRRMARLLVYVVIVAGIFWTTATIAQWSGRGLARDQARHLDRLPWVVLDTRERLYLRSPGIDERALPDAEGQSFHYRYRNLRLLIVGHERMFLVPARWSAASATLVVPLDGSVRVQFQG